MIKEKIDSIYQTNRVHNNCYPKHLVFDGYDYRVRSENEEESTDNEESEDIRKMPPLEGDEEVKEVKGLKRLTPNKLLTRIPVSLAQVKAGSNSYKLKNEIR